MYAGRRLSSGIVWSLVSFLGAAVTAQAQGPIRHTPRPAPFVRYVPASARLFVRVRELAEVDEALHRAHAWRLLPYVSEAAAADGEPLDLRAAIARFLGPQSAIRIDDLMEAEMGLVASSWSQLGGAVWFVRLADDAVLDRWFPQFQSRGRRGSSDIRFFRTSDGVLVCVRDGVAVMARRAGATSLLRDTVELMRRRGGESLERWPDYRDLMVRLPARPLAVAYVANEGARPAEATQPSWWWPAIDRAAVGMYEGGGRIDFSLRASLTAPHRKGRLSNAATTRLMRLPQTTLFAAVFPVDVQQAFEHAAANPSHGTWGRYLTMLSAIRGSSSAEAKRAVELGPHVIVAWGQDLSERGATPQVAVMIESRDVRFLRDEWTHVAGNILNLFGATNLGDRTLLPSIERRTHLGAEVMSVPLGPYARSSRLPFLQMLGNIEPSWATIGNWLVVTLTREHLERVLNAQNGLIPSLAAVNDVRAMNRWHVDPRVLAVAQAGLATDVLSRWLADFEAGKPSLLNPSWWQPREDPEEASRRRLLGIDLQDDPRPGAVVVTRVRSGTPAAGRLHPGDRIIGVDGRILDLRHPGVDFRKRLTASTAEPGPMVRVRRQDTTLDVVLPRDRRDPRATRPPLHPADAVRELASLGRTLQFAVFAVHASREDRYSARLTLRFAPAQTR